MMKRYDLTAGNEPGTYTTGESPMRLVKKGNELSEAQAAPLVAEKILKEVKSKKK